MDFIAQAAAIGKQVDGPVKIIWTREEDVQHDMYRPAFYDRMAAGLDAQGLPVAWSHRICGSSIIARWAPPVFKNGYDPDTIDGALELPYSFPNVRLEYVQNEPKGIQTAFWRSVGPSQNIFVARASLMSLPQPPRKIRWNIAVLCSTNRRVPRPCSIWPPRSQAGTSPCRKAQAAACRCRMCLAATWRRSPRSVSKDGDVAVKRITCAVDCGIGINPNTIEAQAQSAILYGLTAALYGEITLKDGRVEQSNFDNYRALRINEIPAIDIHIIDSGEAPGGMGEPETCAVPPAVTNAIFAATGVRLRKLPIDTSKLKA